MEKEVKSIDLNSNLGDKRFCQERRGSADPNYQGIEKRISGDRREHKRLKVKDLSFVKLWCKNEEDYIENLGQLLDISRGGISLRCSVETEKVQDGFVLGIFVSGGDFKIEEIPFRLISDVEMTFDSALSKRNLRRYCIQFEELTPDQINRLDHFLKNHAIDNLK